MDFVSLNFNLQVSLQLHQPRRLDQLPKPGPPTSRGIPTDAAVQENSVTFTEPNPDLTGRKLSIGSMRGQGKLRPPTPSPLLGSEGFAPSSSKILRRDKTESLRPNASEMEAEQAERPKIIVHDANGNSEVRSTSLEPSLKVSEEALESLGNGLSEQTVEAIEGELSPSARPSFSASTLCVPEVRDAMFDEVGSPRLGLKSMDSSAGKVHLNNFKDDSFQVTKASVRTMMPQDQQISIGKGNYHHRNHAPAWRITGQLIAGLALFNQGL